MKELIDSNIYKKFIEYELGGDLDIIDRLTGVFFEQMGELIHTSIQELDSIAKLSHKLKASAYSFGAIQLVDILILTESAAKGGEVATVKKMIADIEKQRHLIEKQISILKVNILNVGTKS